MLSFFKTQPLLDESSSRWIFDAFAWAIEHYDSEFFARDSQLVLPNNAFFPTRANSVDELANSVFEKVSLYSGLTKWPFKLVEPQQYFPQQYQIEHPTAVIRGDKADDTTHQNMLQNPQDKLMVSYDPVQLNQPQVMVANYAAMLAGYLTGLSNQPPPGGEEHRAPAIEILAIFMGFGVMFANTAYAFRGGCGSCHNHAANRTAVLTENEAVYALALFAALKDIDNKTATEHLKKHLRSSYKQAIKQIKSQPEELNRLKAIMPEQALCAPS
jgi:hypothetical protein